MNFKITPDFSSKVFSKVAELTTQDFDLTEKQAQIDFCNGFVDYLEKEAQLSPAMALGVIQYVCERGAEWGIENSSDKVAAEETWSEELNKTNQAIQELKLKVALEDIVQKEAGVWDVVKGVGKNVYNAMPGLPSIQGAVSNVKGLVDQGLNYVGNKVQQGARQGFINDIKNFGSKAWGYIKDNMGVIAPTLALGLAGALGTRAVGGQNTPGWATALGGLAGAGGGYALSQNEDFKKKMRELNAQWFQTGK